MKTKVEVRKGKFKKAEEENEEEREQRGSREGMLQEAKETEDEKMK